jgi:membrane associated rhomboid family serine protease
MNQPLRDENHPAHRPPPPPRERQPVFNLPAVVTALIAICVGVHVLRVYALDQIQDLELLVRFAFIPVRYSGQYAIDIYAWVSPITYSFLHGDVVHLAVNMIWLAAFGSPLANRIGAWRFCLFWGATVLAAVGLHYVLHPLDATPLVGASGAISGMMGAASRFAFRIDRSGNRASFDGPVLPMSRVFTYRTTVSFLAVWMVVNLAVGLGFGGPGMDGRIAWEAHIGGFLAGFLGVRLFDRRHGPESWRNSS